MKKCVFFDRDGTINIDYGYIYSYEQFVFKTGVIDGIKKLKEAGFIIIVATNQSGIARGKFSEVDLIKLHIQINKKLSKKDANIDAFFYCPHHKDGIVKKYSIDCNCRKPKPGMLLKARREYNIDMKKSFFIGDKYSDIIAAEAAGVGRSFLIGKKSIISVIEEIMLYDNQRK